MECDLLLLFLLPLVDLSVHDLPHCPERPSGSWRDKMDHMLWYRRFSMWGFLLNPQTLILNPSLLPLTGAEYLSSIQSINVGSSLRRMIHTCVCTAHCEGPGLNISNASPINFGLYISSEVVLNMRSSTTELVLFVGHWTLPSIVDEDIEDIFYVVDYSDDFKVCFVHQFSNIVNVFLAKSEILHTRLEYLSMSGIWCVGCLHISME